MQWTLFHVASSANLQLILPSLIVTYWLIWIIYARVFHPLAKYPGPFLASVTRWWLIFDVARGSAHKTQELLHNEYGLIVRIAPNEVAIADPDAIKVIYAVHSGFTKTDFYLPFRAPWGRHPDAFTNLDERYHTERRRIVNAVYSMSNIVQLEESIDKCTVMLMEKLTGYATAGRSIDIAVWTQWYSFDVIGELFFSRMFGFMEGAYDHGGYIHALELLLPIIAVACVMPTCMRLPLFIGGAMTPWIAKALKALKHIENASDACIAERQRYRSSNGANQRKDMLEKFFDIMREKGEQRDFGATEVKMEVYGAFLAGSDTTAAAVTSILYHLMRTPAAYAKLTAEIEEATKSGRLSLPTIQYNEAIGLRYLDACCKEGMRLHPSVGLTLPRHVPRGGCMLAGEWFPEGTRVGVNATIVQRNKEIFGEDADRFVPERWFRKDAANMERYMFQVGAAAKICKYGLRDYSLVVDPGRVSGKMLISLCEMYKLIPQLLRSFHMELSEPGKEWKLRNYWFNKPTKVHTTLHYRETGGH